MLILLLPAAGLIVTFARAALRVGQGVWKKTEGRDAARAGSVLAAAALLAGIAFMWWPNGDYKPIQPGEKGTIQGALAQFAAVPTGRASLTRERAKQLRGAPFRNKQAGNQSSGYKPTSPTTTSTTTSTTTEETTTTESTTTPTAATGTATTETVTTTTTP